MRWSYFQSTPSPSPLSRTKAKYSRAIHCFRDQFHVSFSSVICFERLYKNFLFLPFAEAMSTLVCFHLSKCTNMLIFTASAKTCIIRILAVPPFHLGCWILIWYVRCLFVVQEKLSRNLRKSDVFVWSYQVVMYLGVFQLLCFMIALCIYLFIVLRQS